MTQNVEGRKDPRGMTDMGQARRHSQTFQYVGTDAQYDTGMNYRHLRTQLEAPYFYVNSVENCSETHGHGQRNLHCNADNGRDLITDSQVRTYLRPNL